MITDIERIAGWSDEKILLRVAQAHLRISMMDLPATNSLRERNLVRAGQEMEGCLACHMGDHSYVISGTPTMNAWVLITEAGRVEADRIKLLRLPIEKRDPLGGRLRAIPMSAIALALEENSK